MGSRKNFFGEKENYCIYSIILPIIYTFKIKDREAYNQCLTGETEKLEEALKYLSDYFITNNYGSWLSDFVEIEKKYDEITDEDIIKKISNTFVKAFNSDSIDKIFLKAIKVNI